MAIEIANASGTAIQRNHYYPFGTAFAENTVAEQGKQPYKYNGKELDQMHGLNLYDYSARHKDDWRFISVDPLAEKYYSISPYAYCNNNPIKFVDRNGKAYEIPPIDPTYYQQAAASQYVDNTIKANASVIKQNGVIAVAASSDLNDATVIGTTITRGSNAINIDGTPAGGIGIGFGIGGALLPFVSGSAVKGAFKAIGEALDIGGDVAGATKKVSLRESAVIGQEAHRQIQKELKETAGAVPEVKVRIKGGYVRKDAEMPDGSYVIIKPDTPSGHKSATRRENLMKDNKYDFQTIFYDPKDTRWLPSSPTYIGPKK